MKKGMITEKIIKSLIQAGINGIAIDDLAIIIYRRNNKKTRIRIIKNIGLLRIRKGLNIRYDKKNKRYFLSNIKIDLCP